MSADSAQLLSVMVEMRDLLRLIAEPAIAERDKKLRAALRSIAGAATSKKAKAILLMDGTKTRPQIIAECGIDAGDLSVLIKKLGAQHLLKGEPKQPQISISIPANFFDHDETSDG